MHLQLVLLSEKYRIILHAILIFYCCKTTYCKSNGLKQQKFIRLYLHRSKIWHSLTGFYFLGLTGSNQDTVQTQFLHGILELTQIVCRIHFLEAVNLGFLCSYWLLSKGYPQLLGDYRYPQTPLTSHQQWYAELFSCSNI